jgi:hypothetical protein
MCDEIDESQLTPAELALIRDMDAIEEVERKLEDLRRCFLQKRGWNYTCRIGALWLWRKGPLALDMSTAISLERHWPHGIPGLEVSKAGG